MGACGGAGLAFSATQCSERVDRQIKEQVRSKADLDQKPFWFVHYLRPAIVNTSRKLFAGQSVASALSGLKFVDADMFEGIHGLRRMGERTQGFLAAPHYLHLNDWIAKEQRDASSIYSCR